MDALVLSPTIGDIRWYHIRRSVTLAWLGCLLLRGLLARGGLGFVLVHCERTCVECRDNVDHHHTPLHSCCSWSDSSTTHPIHCCQGPVSKLWIFLKSRTVLSNQLNQSDDSQCCSSDSPDVRMESPNAISFPYPNSIGCSADTGHQGQLILAGLCYCSSDLHQLYKYITPIQQLSSIFLCATLRHQNRATTN